MSRNLLILIALYLAALVGCSTALGSFFVGDPVVGLVALGLVALGLGGLPFVVVLLMPRMFRLPVTADY